MIDPFAGAAAILPDGYSLATGEQIDRGFLRQTIKEELDAIQAHDGRPRVRQFVSQLREARSVDPFGAFSGVVPFTLQEGGLPIGRFAVEDGFDERRFLDVWIATAARGRRIEGHLARLFAASLEWEPCPVCVVVAQPDTEMMAALETAGFVLDVESETHRRYRREAR